MLVPSFARSEKGEKKRREGEKKRYGNNFC
jgi:hypothetical protein